MNLVLAVPVKLKKLNHPNLHQIVICGLSENVRFCEIQLSAENLCQHSMNLSKKYVNIPQIKELTIMLKTTSVIKLYRPTGICFFFLPKNETSF